jgi:hypothetical protein
MSTVEKPTSSLQHEDNVTVDDPTGLLAKGRKILGLDKKTEEDKKLGGTTSTMAPSTGTLLPSSPLMSPSTDRRPSPRGSPRLYPAGAAVSPNRRIRSTSPGLHSPASSQIFERNVQEPEESSAIPAHIKTEDFIPAALDASSLAITDDHLNPDEVEIVTHPAHQPASAAVAGSVSDSTYHSTLSPDDISLTGGHSELGESTSNYASLDTTDVRRLSFISFADVVQAEHVENDRDAMQSMSLSSIANRSPSPVRSPASSHGFSVSPPTSGAPSEKGADFFNKGARLPGSPTLSHGTYSPPLGGGGGELQIETMRQALRKTRSGDLSGAKSHAVPAVSLEDSLADQPPPFV